MKKLTDYTLQEIIDLQQVINAQNAIIEELEKLQSLNHT